MWLLDAVQNKFAAGTAAELKDWPFKQLSTLLSFVETKNLGRGLHKNDPCSDTRGARIRCGY